MGWTGSNFVAVRKDVAPETRRYYQQLTRFSAALAFLADVSMGTLGGALKRKEKLWRGSGDILSLMYLCSATLKRFEMEGRQQADAPLMHWAIWDAMFKAQTRSRRRDLELPELSPSLRSRCGASSSAGPALCRADPIAWAEHVGATADPPFGYARPPDPRQSTSAQRKTTPSH